MENAILPEGYNLHDCFAAYEKRFSLAMAEIPRRLPWVESDRAEILAAAAHSLRLHEEWIPTITPQTVAITEYDGFSIEHLQFTSWPGCRGAAFLYRPSNPPSRTPIVHLACGHGAGGKHAPGYRTLAEHLARSGVSVLIPDNIGQGERELMGHKHVPGVFAAGLTLQGLIIMEAIAWLRWIEKQDRFDPTRIGFTGNSGGGTQALFVSAFCREIIAAASSSGYPSSFEFVARKEKEHCHCNLLPEIVGEIEMWQLLGCYAPKPLFIFQGSGDPLFPPDLFHQTAARVENTFVHLGARDAFQASLFGGGHPWDGARRLALTKFFCEQFQLPFEERNIVDPSIAEPPANCFPEWPVDALTAEEVARQLSGCCTTAETLTEIFPPALTPIGENRLLRGKPSAIFAQYEAYLGKNGLSQ